MVISTVGRVKPVDKFTAPILEMFVVMIMLLSLLKLIVGPVTLADTFTALISDALVVMLMFLSWLTFVARGAVFLVALVVFADLVTFIFALVAVSFAAKLAPIKRARSINSGNNLILVRLFIVFTGLIIRTI